VGSKDKEALSDVIGSNLLRCEGARLNPETQVSKVSPYLVKAGLDVSGAVLEETDTGLHFVDDSTQSWPEVSRVSFSQSLSS
jgi:hypothetical protein